jgi:hypothetical protein
MTETSTNEIYKTLSKLREKYTDADDLSRIDSDYRRITSLFKTKGFAENESVQELISICRKDIIFAKRKLATDKTLVGNKDAQLELWFIIESREWFLNIVSQDFDSEIQTIHSELESELIK